MSTGAILFDATGTLIELRESVGESYARQAARFGVKLPAWRLEDAFQRILRRAPAMVFPDESAEGVARCERDWWRQIVRSTFLAADSTVRFADFESFFDSLYDHYSSAEAWRARPAARSALLALRRRGLQIGIVSNFDQRLPNILEAVEIVDLIDSVMIPAICRAQKPDRRIFEAALASLEVSAHQAVFVGDDPEADLAAARAAGLRAIDVTSLPDLAALPAQLDALATLEPRGAGRP